MIMKKIASSLIVFSLLTGITGQAFAANDNNTTNLQDLERHDRAGNPGE
jgi:hypothetical protein